MSPLLPLQIYTLTVPQGESEAQPRHFALRHWKTVKFVRSLGQKARKNTAR